MFPKSFGLSLEKCGLRSYRNQKTSKANSKKKSGGGSSKKRKYSGPSQRNSRSPISSKRNTPEFHSLPIPNRGMIPDTTSSSNSRYSRKKSGIHPLLMTNRGMIPDSLSNESAHYSSSDQIQDYSSNQDHSIDENALIHVCPNAGECMAIGREKEAIRDFFGGFTTFEHVAYPIKQIGGSSNSKHGFIKKIRYRRGKYSCYALLKSSLSVYSDNLAYEYEVGLFINKKCKILPCFVETYGLYYYKSDEAYHTLKTHKKNYKPLNQFLQLENAGINYGKACARALHVAILTEHVGYTTTLKALYYKRKNKNHLDSKEDFLWDELPKILFQVYYGLAILAMESSFTHYDLHWGNVIVYELPEPKCVNFEYKSLLGEHEAPASFKTRYIAKIIDYGRCFYRDDERGVSSFTAYRQVCKTPECEKPINKKDCKERYKDCDKYKCSEPDAKEEEICFTSDCGVEFGFNELVSRFHDRNRVFNASHDLQLLAAFKTETMGTIDHLLYFLEYEYDSLDSVIKQDTYPTKISTVVDAAKMLERCVKSARSPDGTSVGTIIVDGIHELQYIPEPTLHESVPFP